MSMEKREHKNLTLSHREGSSFHYYFVYNNTHSSILAVKSHRQRSLGGDSPWSCQESDTIERLNNNYYIAIK